MIKGRFSSKAAMVRFCKNVLGEYAPGEVLRGADREAVIELINLHPKAKDKIGCGIKDILIKTDPIWKRNKQFWIVRTDGTMIDFSYHKCVHGEPSTLDTFRAACRTAVANDIFKFKLAELAKSPNCPFKNMPLDMDNSHVDHVMPRSFNVLVNCFIQKYNIQVENIEICGSVNRQFKDRQIADKFLNFHRKHAKLELVSAAANQDECKRRN